MLVSGTLEYLTGKWMFFVYGRNWWSYKNMFLNIDGYVCLGSILLFGFGSIMLTYLIIPSINKIIEKTNSKILNRIITIILLFLFVDWFISTFFKY